MSAKLSGPMFEPAKSDLWESVSGKIGAHYNCYGCRDKNGMVALRQLFPDGQAGELNVALFSTSGVLGTYATIEDCERGVLGGGDPDDAFRDVAFVVVQPRLCCLRYGNCQPRTSEDFAFLKRLRETSWEALLAIGRESTPADAGKET